MSTVFVEFLSTVAVSTWVEMKGGGVHYYEGHYCAYVGSVCPCCNVCFACPSLQVAVRTVAYTHASCMRACLRACVVLNARCISEYACPPTRRSIRAYTEAGA